MKKLITTFLCIFALSQTANADTKIAVLDMQKIMDHSVAYKDIMSQMSKKDEANKTRASEIQQKLQIDFKALEKKKPLVKPEEHNKNLRELEDRAQKIHEELYMEKISQDNAYAEAAKKLMAKVHEIVAAEASGRFDLVIVKQYALYAASSLEITDDILNKLNESIKSIPVEFEKDDKKIDSDKSSK